MASTRYHDKLHSANQSAKKSLLHGSRKHRAHSDHDALRTQGKSIIYLVTYYWHLTPMSPYTESEITVADLETEINVGVVVELPAAAAGGTTRPPAPQATEPNPRALKRTYALLGKLPNKPQLFQRF